MNNLIDNLENKFLKKYLKIKYDSIPLNCHILEHITGLIHYPRGKIIEIFGEESQGKTTFIWYLLANFSIKYLPIYIDAENSLSPHYAELIGVNLENIGFVGASLHMNQVLESLLKAKDIDLIIVDSFSALYDLEGIDLGKLNTLVHQSNKCVIFTNQIRCNIRKHRLTSYGKLKEFADIRINVKKEKVNKNKDNEIESIKLNIKTVKNKLTPTFKDTSILITYDKSKIN